MVGVRGWGRGKGVGGLLMTRITNLNLFHSCALVIVQAFLLIRLSL